MMRDRSPRVSPSIGIYHASGVSRVHLSCRFCRASFWLLDPGPGRRRVGHRCEEPPRKDHYQFEVVVRLPCGEWYSRRCSGQYGLREPTVQLAPYAGEFDSFGTVTGRISLRGTPSAKPNPIQQLWRRTP